MGSWFHHNALKVSSLRSFVVGNVEYAIGDHVRLKNSRKHPNVSYVIDNLDYGPSEAAKSGDSNLSVIPPLLVILRSNNGREVTVSPDDIAKKTRSGKDPTTHSLILEGKLFLWVDVFVDGFGSFTSRQKTLNAIYFR